ncbi:hypothetical protein [Fluviispira sanaruensis]|nr:hypothetical protein [Fluviispira sanaruensis]
MHSCQYKFAGHKEHTVSFLTGTFSFFLGMNQKSILKKETGFKKLIGSN